MCVLAAIKSQDSYGYQIIKDMKPYIELSESTLYTILKRLETAHMLTVRTAEHGGRIRKYYRITPEGVIACGSPWMGKHGLGCNGEFPLRAVCVLTRGAENAISPLPARQAVPMLLQQSNRPRDGAQLPQYLHLLDALAGRVKFYQLACNMEPEAAMVAYEAMKG